MSTQSNIVLVTFVMSLWAWTSGHFPLRAVNIKIPKIKINKTEEQLRVLPFNHSEYRYGDCGNRKKMYYMNESFIFGKDIYREKLVTRYVKIDDIPKCTVVLAKSEEENLVHSSRLPMQVCWAMLTFIYKRFINTTVMLEVAFNSEFEAPLDFHMLYYDVEGVKSREWR